MKAPERVLERPIKKLNDMMEIYPPEPDSWNSMVASLPNSHVLQTWQWGQIKSSVGWQATPFVWKDNARRVQAASLVLQRALPMRGLSKRLRVMYIPKGPVLDWGDAQLRRTVLADLAVLARQQGAIFIKLDPDIVLGQGIPGNTGTEERPQGQEVLADLRSRGWLFSAEQIQFRNTVQVDLSPTEEVLLANMKQKTRYNVRLAIRKGVLVRTATVADLELLYQMYAETSMRDGFVIREQGYYQAVWSNYLQAGMAEALIAEVDGEAVAAVIIFRFGWTAWYMYGMSREAHRDKMPSVLLQWEAMCRAKACGCRTYDLWGAPDEFVESDPLWGVYRFKEGLEGRWSVTSVPGICPCSLPSTVCMRKPCRVC